MTNIALPELIKKHPLLIAPFHPSNVYQTISGLLASAMVGLKILVISDNKHDIDHATGQVISNDIICTYETFRNLTRIPDVIIIVDNVIKFQHYNLHKLFSSNNKNSNNLIFIGDLNLNSENYKYLFEFFPTIKKINFNLLNNFPIIKIQKFHFNLSEDLYNKYRNLDDKSWHNLCFYETDQIQKFNISTSLKIKSVITKISLNINHNFDTSRHLIYISPDIIQGVENLQSLLNSVNISNCILEKSFLDKNFKGVFLTSEMPEKCGDILSNLFNISEIHFMGNIDYKIYSSWLKVLYQVKNYDLVIPEIIVNFYLTSFPEDGHISPDDHHFHLLERELQYSREVFFPYKEAINLCWKNKVSFVCCIST